jgi:predicted permease
MLNLLFLFLFLLLGFALQGPKFLPRNTHLFFNLVILRICLPAAILLSVPSITWSGKLLSLGLAAWIIFGAAYYFFNFYGHKFGWDKKVIGCLILTAGLGNTSFIGFPVILGMLGDEAFSYAVVFDQMGTFLICSTLGLWLVNAYSSYHLSDSMLVKRIIQFPPFLAFSAALILSFYGWEASGDLRWWLELLVFLLGPLAFMSVGLQLKIQDIRFEWKYLKWGLGFKLILAPMIIYFLYLILGVPREIFQVALLESAMAPMITASILAASYGLHPRLASLMVGVGVPVSFLTLSLWYLLL